MIRTMSKVGLAAGAAIAVCGIASLAPVKADNGDNYGNGNNNYQSTPMQGPNNGMRYNHMRFNGNIQDGTGIRVIVNHQTVNFNGPGPIMVGGDHVFVPVRGVFEQMGGYV